MTFTDQNSRPLEIQDKGNLTLLINRIGRLFYRTRKYVKGNGFLSQARNLSNKCGKQLIDNTTKTELDALKAASKKLVHKTAEATGEFIGTETKLLTKF